MKKINLLLITALMIFTVIISGCDNQQTKESTFKLGIVTWVGFGPFYIAQEKGFFEEEGLNVEIKRIEELGALRSALISKQLDGIVHTIDSWASAAAEGLPAVCVLKIDESYGGDGIVVNKEVETIADLKGKTVAFPRGLAGHFFLLHLMKEHNMKSSDIVEQHMEAGAAASAFIANKIDAAVTWEPFLTEAGKTEHGKVLFTTVDYPGLITDILLVRNNVAKNRKEDVEKLIKGWFKAIEFIDKNEEEAVRIMKEKFGIPGEEITGMLSGLKFTSLNENLKFFNSNSDNQSDIVTIFNEAGEVYHDAGLITKPVNGLEYFNATFINKIAK